MNDDIGCLPDDPALLKRMLAKAMARVNFLEEQFKLAQHQRFGKSSEAHPAQAELFDEAETVLEAAKVDEQEHISYTRNKPKRTALPADLPRKTIVHDIADEDKTCDCCGHDLHRMGEDRSEKLEFIPAKIKVIEHVRPKYSCRHCENTWTRVNIKQAPAPVSPIPKGIATASLLSQIITSKYQYSLPLYRQESLFKQYGIHLSRQTMAQWMIKCSDLLIPLYHKLKEHLLEQCVIQADETTLNVLSEDKAKCYMWLYCTGTDSPNGSSIPNIVLYDYQGSRAGQCAADYLAGYEGYLQVDGYQGYHQTQATLVGCWAHVRRKFKEAKIAQPKGKTGKADWALSHIQKLYRLESQLKDKSAAEKYQLRQEKAVPLLKQMKAWLDKSVNQVPPSTALGKALQYNLNQWTKLVRYVDSGNLSIDNNRAERAVKPFVIGRKNWLFSNTAKGARASAMLYSLIETAKANDLVPFDYLMYCLEQLANNVAPETLLPWKVDIS
ncbi:IS66 family transposase [Thalassomonas haliotis]|uniref:IS66 family transposase n=1 Tax=Thalassomonas haliotis TaxID=485448 RepID=A0ABY7VEP8_9GAMM|nr:IS66 family transposase [Thalassomonas haliotis]WDE11856.1 IS66 family transposase [Thalassomonas haliotis]